MTTSVDKFNSLFNEFIDKIINKYPNQTLNDYKKAFVLLKITSFLNSTKSFIAFFKFKSSGTPLFRASIFIPKEVCKGVNLNN